MHTIKYQELFNYKTQFKYKVLDVRNLSRPSALRYAITIGLKNNYANAEIKEILHEVVDEAKKISVEFFYKKDIMDEEGGLMYTRTPDVIWVYVKPIAVISEVPRFNWIARAAWVTSETEFKGREIAKPKLSLDAEIIDDIYIFWVQV